MVACSEEFLETWDYLFGGNADYLSHAACAAMIMALDGLQHQHKDTLQGLRIVATPASARDVFTKRDFAKGKLVLIPVSASVGTAKKVPPSALPGDVAFTCGDNTYYYAINAKITLPPKEEVKDAPCSSGSCVSEFIAPFWFVGTVGETVKANLQFEIKSIKVGGRDIQVPILSNDKPVKKDTQLTFYKSPSSPSKWTSAAQLFHEGPAPKKSRAG